LDLQIKSYACLKFQGEVWAGRACAAANEKELTNCAKNRGQEEEKKSRKMGTARQAEVSTHGRRATAGHRLALGHRPAGGDLWSALTGHRARAACGSTPQLVELYLVF
jgi:hypothetical protein